MLHTIYYDDFRVQEYFFKPFIKFKYMIVSLCLLHQIHYDDVMKLK